MNLVLIPNASWGELTPHRLLDYWINPAHVVFVAPWGDYKARIKFVDPIQDLYTTASVREVVSLFACGE